MKYVYSKKLVFVLQGILKTETSVLSINSFPRAPIIQLPQANNRLNLEQRVERMANQLRVNHECRHTAGWAYTRGGGRCDECNHYLPQYLFRCYRCHVMVCNRCRRNRL
jgi:hypothetical protein